jgi:hypothetical protein
MLFSLFGRRYINIHGTFANRIEAPGTATKSRYLRPNPKIYERYLDVKVDSNATYHIKSEALSMPQYTAQPK